VVLVAEVGLPVVLPGALAAACAGAVAVVKPMAGPGAAEMLQPELAGIKQFAGAVKAPLLAMLGGVPVLIARHVHDVDTPVWKPALAASAIPLGASLIALVYLRMREQARAWWERQMSLANQGSMVETARKEAEARVEARMERTRAQRAQAQRTRGDAEEAERG
jgi:hypothetical protein